MQAVLEKPQHTRSENPHTSPLPHPLVREGDWQAYCRALKQCASSSDAYEDLALSVARKREHAFAYLGKRAMLYGGACSRTTPRILTPQFVMMLEKENRIKRYARYPWLEKLMKLLAEIEVLQEEQAGNNVFSLVRTK